VAVQLFLLDAPEQTGLDYLTQMYYVFIKKYASFAGMNFQWRDRNLSGFIKRSSSSFVF